MSTQRGNNECILLFDGVHDGVAVVVSAARTAPTAVHDAHVLTLAHQSPQALRNRYSEVRVGRRRVVAVDVARVARERPDDCERCERQATWGQRQEVVRVFQEDERAHRRLQREVTMLRRLHHFFESCSISEIENVHITGILL